MSYTWDDIRSQAQLKRAEIGALSGRDPGVPLASDELLELVEEVTGVPRIPLPPGDPLLFGAEAWLGGEPEDQVIYFNEGALGWQAAFYQAHEYAHLWLHHTGGPTTCDADDVDPSASEADLSDGAESVEGYGTRERREREANVFAREFLLPTNLLATWYL